MSFKVELSRSPRRARQALANTSRQLVSEYGFYKNEVDPAVSFVQHMLQGKRTGLIAWPMQSGKTNIIACVFHLLKALIPNLHGIFICANDQVDLRRQNLERLEHLPDFEVLTRVDRKRWNDVTRRALLIVFYDENHFGDGIDMTVNEFLEQHGIKRSEKIAFCGVSATPFTSLGCLDFQIWPDLKSLEKDGYNSPGMMLKRSRIQLADKLFSRPNPMGAIEINENANVYKHMVRAITRKIPSGYAMVRARLDESQALEAHLKKKFGGRVFIKYWNMHAKDFSPESFFSVRRTGVFTIVMVQHKARMGNTIDTRHFEFLYENSPSACLDTILQSFIGRACGFGKQDHRAVVYSNPKMAEAYTKLISSQGSEKELVDFRSFCIANDIRPAVRATLHSRKAEFEVEVVAEKHFKETEAEKVRPWIERVTSGKGFREGSVRTLSKTTIPERKQGRRIFHPDYTDNSLFCGTTPGDWSAFIYDDYKKGSVLSKKDWKGVVVKIARRTDQRTGNAQGVGPTEHSLHTTFAPVDKKRTQSR